MSPRFLERYALPGLLALLPIGAAFSQSTSARPAISANDMVRAVVANELKAQGGSYGRWMYRVDKEEQNKQKAKEVVQTGQGSLELLVAIEGRPLNGKALFFKTVAVKEKEYRSNFQTVPDGLTLAEAADILAKQVIVATNR